MTEKSCPRCKAFWLESTPTCRFCGFQPTVGGTPPSHFDPDHQADSAPASAGLEGGGSKRRISGVVTLAVALVGAVGLAGAIAFVASRTVLEEDHGNHELSAVCDGEGHADAASYDPSGAPSGLLVLRRDGEKWNASDSKPASDIDLVACRTLSTGPFRSLGCQGRWASIEDGWKATSGGQGEIVTFSTDLYRITLEFRDARTGELVTTENVAPPLECPSSDDLFALDARNKRHRVIPNAEADAIVAAYEKSGSA